MSMVERAANELVEAMRRRNGGIYVLPAWREAAVEYAEALETAGVLADNKENEE